MKKIISLTLGILRRVTEDSSAHNLLEGHLKSDSVIIQLIVTLYLIFKFKTKNTWKILTA